VKNDDKTIWTRKEDRTCVDDAEDLAYGPSGGRAKQWLAGVILASLPIIYGVVCIRRGHTTLFGRRGSDLDLSRDAALSLAISYIAIGAFLHFHYFWGLSEHLWRFSQAGKVVSVLIFLPSFLYALYRIFF
jgi:hypothetical protein